MSAAAKPISDLTPNNNTMPAHGVGLGEAFRVWQRIALLSFGGPAGQIAVMHRIVVQERRWISEARFLHALNYCHLLPGPEAQQLAIYIGWLMHRTRGGLIAGVLFVVPGVIALMALSWIYVLWGDVSIVAGLLFGLKAAVLAVVIEAVLRVGRRALESQVAVAIAAAAFVGLFFFALPFPLVVMAAALVGFVADHVGYAVGGNAAHGKHDDDLLGEHLPDHTRPSLARAITVVATWLPLWFGPVALLLLLFGPDNVFTKLAVFFSEVAVVSFGGAYAVLAYVAQEAVGTHHWVSAGEMLTGLGMAETTPGPLIMVVQYVGFLAGYWTPGTMPPLLTGSLAGLLVTWVTFTPCFLWVFLGAPYVEALRGVRGGIGAGGRSRWLRIRVDRRAHGNPTWLPIAVPVFALGQTAWWRG
jgi:chromate transporter